MLNIRSLAESQLAELCHLAIKSLVDIYCVLNSGKDGVRLAFNFARHIPFLPGSLYKDVETPFTDLARSLPTP
jgi:hypothetical protein